MILEQPNFESLKIHLLPFLLKKDIGFAFLCDFVKLLDNFFFENQASNLLNIIKDKLHLRYGNFVYKTVRFFLTFKCRQFFFLQIDINYGTTFSTKI